MLQICFGARVPHASLQAVHWCCSPELVIIQSGFSRGSSFFQLRVLVVIREGSTNSNKNWLKIAFFKINSLGTESNCVGISLESFLSKQFRNAYEQWSKACSHPSVNTHAPH